MQGFGGSAKGGKGGDTYTVTNLNNTGTGSFRDALDTQDGPRTIEFSVGGLIVLGDNLFTRKSYLTIAGETAPEPGITISQNGITFDESHNCIIRHIRSRCGDLVTADLSSFFFLNCNDMHASNLSISWGVDENGSAFTASDATSPSTNITFDRCIFSEGLYDSVHSKGIHSMGCIAATTGITIHHCLFAHNNLRNPFIRGKADIVNNVIYNWGQFGTHIHSPVTDPDHLNDLGTAEVNLVNNYYKSGTNSNANSWSQAFNNPELGNPKIWDNGGNLVDDAPSGTVLGTPDLQTSRFAFPEIQTHSALRALTIVLDEAGATLPSRDAHDTRIVNDVQNGTGNIINSQTEVGGW
jgi:hypothetical protein